MTETDNEVIAHIKEFHFPLNSAGVYLKKSGHIWSVCLGDEDELIIEDSEEGIFLTEGAVYNRALVTPDVLELAKELVKEEEG